MRPRPECKVLLVICPSENMAALGWFLNVGACSLTVSSLVHTGTQRIECQIDNKVCAAESFYLLSGIDIRANVRCVD
jgi:hypothetical protein